jgi:uncharacterized protein
MEISKDIFILGTSLFLAKHKILIINDLHIGYEESLYNRGILVPKFQLKEILSKLEDIIEKSNPSTVIINGDLKHEFGRVSNQEWREVLQLLDFLLTKCQKIIIIKGNHDPIINPVAAKRRVSVVDKFHIDDILIVHGDQLVETTAKRIIIGHEHPAITVREGSKAEKYKCFLKGKWQRHELIAVPSFNPLLEGTDILKEQLLSPFLKNLKNFSIYIVNKSEVYNFGKLKQLQSKFV